jgi:ketosteroid isomerase-like protein
MYRRQAAEIHRAQVRAKSNGPHVSKEIAMVDRAVIEGVLTDLYEARCLGDLESLCALFDSDATFRIAGSSAGKPIAMSAQGMVDIGPWLALLIKSFKISDHKILSLLVDKHKAAVHWKADILSRITGAVVSTELFDLVEIRGTLIVSYVELFLPG